MEDNPVSAESEYWISLARAQTEQFWRDVDAEFGLLSAADAARTLGVASDELSRLRRTGNVLAVELAGELRFPAFQFAGGAVHPVIAKLTALRLLHDVPEKDVIYWLCAPTTYFRDERRPVDHLDDPDSVVWAADQAWGVTW